MGLLVKDYAQKGTKMVEKFVTQQSKARHDVHEELDSKKVKILETYRNTNKLIDQSSKDAQDFSVSSYQKTWGKEQDMAAKKIAEGMGMVE